MISRMKDVYKVIAAHSSCGWDGAHLINGVLPAGPGTAHLLEEEVKHSSTFREQVGLHESGRA